jgi:hypothetical protein
MRGKTIFAGLILTVSASVAAAQEAPKVPTPGQVDCAGVVTSESVPRDALLVTGEQSNYRITFDAGDYVYISKGASQGAKVGDEFFIIRPVTDSIESEWTKWQTAILHKMGTVWEDEGRVKLLVVRSDISIGQVEHACDYMQRGDIALPFAERPAPPIKSGVGFDRFAAPNGKPLAMVITGKKFQQQSGTNDVVYVNLGADQGVKVGDYFRIFRYQGTEHETAYTVPRNAFEIEKTWGPTLGLGAAPNKYKWDNTPREDIGEGVVLRTGPNSSTVLITFTLREIFSGDYVEIE